jgi:hypothetical protein
MVIGVKLVVNEAEATIIRHIFELRAKGLTFGRIAKLLEVERVPLPSQRSGQGSLKWWTPGRILAIVGNTRYLGRIVFGHTRRLRNPQSGKIVVKHLPAAEWLDREIPELRIVSDELWRKAQGRREDGGPTR